MATDVPYLKPAVLRIFTTQNVSSTTLLLPSPYPPHRRINEPPTTKYMPFFTLKIALGSWQEGSWYATCQWK